MIPSINSTSPVQPIISAVGSPDRTENATPRTPKMEKMIGTITKLRERMTIPYASRINDWKKRMKKNEN